MSKTRNIHPDSFAVNGDRLCCLDKILGYVVEINIPNRKVENVLKLPNSINLDDESRTLIHYYDDKIIVLPNNENGVYICDFCENKWIRNELENTSKTGFYLFSSSKVVDDYLYLFPFTEPHIIKYDLKANRIEFSENLFETLKKYFKEDFISINAPAWINERTVAGCISQNNHIFFYDLDTQKTEIYGFDMDGCIITSVASVEDSLLFHDKRNQKTYKVNMTTRNIEGDLSSGNKRARITGVNSKFAVLELVDSDMFCILNKDLNSVYVHNETLKFEERFVESDGVIVFGEETGYYYNKILRKLFMVSCKGEVDEIEVFKDMDFSSCDMKTGYGKRIVKESIIYNLKDFISEI